MDVVKKVKNTETNDRNFRVDCSAFFQALSHVKARGPLNDDLQASTKSEIIGVVQI